MLKNIFCLCLIIFSLAACSKKEESKDAISLGSTYSRQKLDEMRQTQNKAYEEIKHIFKNNSHIKSDGKLVAIIFSIPNCVYCDELYEEIAKSKEVQEKLEDEFDSYHVLFSLEKKVLFFNDKTPVKTLSLAERFEINATPTFVFLDQNGKEIFAYAGFIGTKRLLATLDFLKANSKLSEAEIGQKIQAYYRAKKV